jgi:hypothetical protein
MLFKYKFIIFIIKYINSKGDIYKGDFVDDLPNGKGLRQIS